jgi:hypothetical protein
VRSGIEFAFASLLIDHGRYADGVKIVEAIHRRYQRAGQPWNQVECGGHYSRAMSSWATMLAITGFKPDLPKRTMVIAPGTSGDFRAPWVMASGIGTISRTGQRMSIHCAYGRLDFKTLEIPSTARLACLGSHTLDCRVTASKDGVTLVFMNPVSIAADQTLTIS